ncbi:MAG: hypothetical protein A2V67_10530 [Deltaproteobacteria bacterium RBG_13_61_14]|nr:MAG: hypothetical protein A2V67_10530 [Deltaproteobacteria bacterium RBG_13_61_14]
MSSKRGFWYSCILIVLLVLASGWAGAQQPQQQQRQRPAGKRGAQANRQAGQEVTKEDLAKMVKRFVERQTTLQGGEFVFYDQETKKPMVLTLEKVHEDRLAKTGENSYFVCADFKGPEGKAYDLDFFLVGEGRRRPRVTEISIHKAAGKERYSWVEENSIWKKKLVAAAGKAGEKTPEKPAQKTSEPAKGTKTP